MSTVEFEEEVFEFFVYDVDLAIEMLDKVKELLKDIQNSSQTPVAFVKITGYFDVESIKFKYNINTINCNPKKTAVVNAKNIFR
jgi:precorrin-4 methylase